MSMNIIIGSILVAIFASAIVFILSWETVTTAQLAMTAVLSYLISCNTAMHVRL